MRIETPFASLAYLRGLPLFLFTGSEEEGERSPPKSFITTKLELSGTCPGASPSRKKEAEEMALGLGLGLGLGLVKLMLKSDADAPGSELRLGVEFRLEKV
jgi:hypothetical protein